MLVSNLAAHETMTPNGTYKTLLDRHRKTTEEHAKAVEQRINELGEDCDTGIVQKATQLARDAVGQALVLTKGPVDMLRGTGVNEKLLKNAKDECTTEAQEIATYDALEAAAIAAGDDKTAKLARDHRKDEERMLEALRREIPKLVTADVKERTDGPVQTTTTRSNSGRATSRSSSGRKTATRKAGTAKKKATTTRSSTSSTSSSSSRSTSGGTKKKSSGGTRKSSSTRSRSTAKKS
jgi:ferritin-like metal-binding protein YciE